ncbi:MAG: SBBP repeat-containing protein [Bryobacter sp.]|nr:SBBP repeat-containing protein [Bryobacter sp.]
MLVLAVLGLAAGLAAQTPAYQWHTFYNQGATGWQGGAGQSVATDGDGNVYVTGTTYNPGSFAPGLPVHAVPDSARSAFLMKIGPAGNLIWHTFYTGPQGVSAAGIAVDDYGGVYITGNGEVWPDGSQPPLHAGSGPQSLFVLKVNRDGLFQWHTHYGDGDTGRALAVDRVRNYLYVTGDKHSHTVWGPETPLRPHTMGTNDIFTLALGLDGTHWWYTFHGPGGGNGRGVAVDGAGNILVGGTQSNGNTILKLNAPGSAMGWGSLAWGYTYGNGGTLGLAVDAAGNVFAAGMGFAGTGPAGQSPLFGYCAPNGYCGFVMKVSPEGLYQWHTQYGSDMDGLLLDGLGHIYAVGNDPFTANFTAGTTTVNSLHANGEGGHFVVALTTNGAYQWHTTYGKYQWHAAHGIAIDGNRNLYVTGGSGVFWAGDGGAQPLEQPNGGDNAFVQKFALKATPVLTWANPAAIVFGTALSGTQLKAAANVAGTFVYSPAAGTVLPVGNGQSLTVTFTPVDTANYQTAAKTVQIDVLPAPLVTPARLAITRTLQRANGQVWVNVAITNTGGTAALNVQLTTGRINTTNGAPLPQAVGMISPGATVTKQIAFPGSVGNAGAAAVLTLGGTHSIGSFSNATRVTLP